ncbi:hypothetical protein [Shewanella saliphila]|uniref:Uncharacterized protein n=1 Tax=Shewanella saliphila TaxID=2282698 RepID=A0ABQ2Q918_9GAMM|nr:hypothetical protein [Shewanella saliphila]MCL1102438.1 hypothetical protein [Shewanella saliphila]GGP56312.1 hypothetical protein GCM10009409_23100 [Shewanella saliphila]
MVRLSANEKIQPHWWSKTLAGLLFGLMLAYGIVGIFAWYGYGGIDAPVKVQFNMWMICPIWILVLSLSYLFKTGVNAVVYLLSLNAIVYGIFFILRWLS